MTLWVVRGGRAGEHEDYSLEHSVVVLGWEELPDLQQFQSRDAFQHTLQRIHPEFSDSTVGYYGGEIWSFVHRIEGGDTVVLPLKTRAAVAVGTARGPYQYRPNVPPEFRHIRPMNWLRTDIPRNSFDAETLQGLSVNHTVYHPWIPPDAEERVLALAKGQPVSQPTDSEVDEAEVNIDQYARDQIQRFIASKFQRHELARLVDGVLRAQDYQTRLSPPGPDGGVDILAGLGPLGFETPRLVVQVKSSNQPVGIGTLNELRGAVVRLGASYGLLVSWGGFTDPVIKQLPQEFFSTRLWDADALLDSLLLHYEKLSPDLQAELPLKRIWTLVQEEL